MLVCTSFLVLLFACTLARTLLCSHQIAAMADIENGEQPELDLSDDKVVTKYKAAAEICNSECLPAKQRRLGDRRPGVASGCIYGTISRVRNHKMFICCEASNCSRLRLHPWPLPYELALDAPTVLCLQRPSPQLLRLPRMAQRLSIYAGSVMM